MQRGGVPENAPVLKDQHVYMKKIDIALRHLGVIHARESCHEPLLTMPNILDDLMRKAV